MTRATTSARFFQYQAVLTYEPASFWRENVIIIVIQLRVFAETSQSNVRGFVILRQGEGSTSFNKDNSGNLSGEKKVNWNFPMSRTRSRSRLTSNLEVPSFTWLGTTTTCVRKECDRYCFYIRTQISFGLYENKQEVWLGWLWYDLRNCLQSSGILLGIDNQNFHLS